MIFNRKNLNIGSGKVERGIRTYTAGDPSIISITCFGNRFRANGPIRYWECHVNLTGIALDAVSQDNKYKKVFDFIIDHNKWYDKWFLESLEEAMQKGGKYKLIRAIYNDFG